jgi:hypothetical protein
LLENELTFIFIETLELNNSSHFRSSILRLLDEQFIKLFYGFRDCSKKDGARLEVRKDQESDSEV